LGILLAAGAIPIMTVHGDTDHTVPVEASSGAVAGLNELGTAYEYIEVPGSGHGDVVAPMAMMNLIPPRLL
jgi:dipeptidyl aminopeptidase/acylaminoacyl peptidase